MTIEHEITGEAPIALYRLFAPTGALLYVGITDNPSARFAEHSQVKPWWPDVVRKTVAWYGNRTEALAAESLAIESEAPLHNQRGRPKPQGSRGRDRHKITPLRFRPPEEERLWLVSYQGQTRRPMNAILTEAVQALRAQKLAEAVPKGPDAEESS